MTLKSSRLSLSLCESHGIGLPCLLRQGPPLALVAMGLRSGLAFPGNAVSNHRPAFARSLEGKRGCAPEVCQFVMGAHSNNWKRGGMPADDFKSS